MIKAVGEKLSFRRINDYNVMRYEIARVLHKTSKLSMQS